MKHGNLSTWNNAFGDIAYQPQNPYATRAPSTDGVDYRGSAINTANFSFQEGYADPYGNVFERIFTPRKWESERGLTQGDASLFKKGSSGRQDYFSKRRETRKTKRSKRKQKRSASQYRVVQGAGGYVYKQRGDGTIEIISGPKAVGKVLRPGDTGYSAIVAQISERHGAFDQKPSAADWMRIGAGGAGAAVDIISALRQDTPQDGGGYPGGAAPAAGIPSWLLPVGAGLVGIIILTSVLKR